MAKCYKNLKDADTKYLDYAIDFYKKSYEINRHKVKQEYLSLLHEKWDELYEKGNDIEEILKEIQRIEPGDARITEKLVVVYILKNKDISEIKAEYLLNVKELILNDKHLTQLPEGIGFLKNLKKLDLRNNELVRLPPQVTQLKNLEVLSLTGNPIDISDNILKGSVEEILKYISLNKYYTEYFNAMKKDFESIWDIAAIGQKEPVPLETIYVSLKLSQEIRRPDLLLDKDQKEPRIYDEEETQEMERKLERTEMRDRVMDVDSAVKNINRMVVVGAPGAGKTTLLKHLALKYCKENIDKQERVTVPIPVTLRESMQSGKGLREYIDDVFEKYCFNEATEFVEKELQNGKCMLLLDGFDELATKESQAKAAEQIHDFIREYPLCRFIVTSRIAGYHDELSGFTRLELMDFDGVQMKEFIAHWFGQAEPKKAASMWNAVKANESIGKLARNPLLMTIIAIIYEEDQELPQGRAALYERSVDVLLSRWDKAKKLKNKFSPKNKVFILRKLAYESHCLNRRAMSHLDIMGIIDQYASRIGLKKEEYESFLTEIWERSYLLRQIAVDTYDFLHLSFQEYFTALELREQADGIGTIIKHIDEPWWEEPMLLYAGISRDATELIRRIQKEVPEDMFYSNLILTGKCIADAPFTESRLKDEIVQTVWEIYQETEFELLRNSSMEVLSRIKPQQIIDRLILKLRDKEPNVLSQSAKILGKMRWAGAVPHLIEVLINEKNEDDRMSVIDSLGKIGDDKAVPHLIEALRNDKSDFVRSGAALALGEIGNAEATPHLIEALKNDKAENVRGNAAFALEKIGGAEVVPHRIKPLNNNNGERVIKNVASTLETIGNADAVSHLIQELKNNEDKNVRSRAAYDIGKISSPAAVPYLIQALNKDKDKNVRSSASDALVEIGSSEIVPHLIRAMENDKEVDVRSSAAYALGKIGDDSVIPYLKKSLQESLQDDAEEDMSKLKDAVYEALEMIGKRLQKRILFEYKKTRRK